MINLFPSFFPSNNCLSNYKKNEKKAEKDENKFKSSTLNINHRLYAVSSPKTHFYHRFFFYVIFPFYLIIISCQLAFVYVYERVYVRSEWKNALNSFFINVADFTSVSPVYTISRTVPSIDTLTTNTSSRELTSGISRNGSLNIDTEKSGMEMFWINYKFYFIRYF